MLKYKRIICWFSCGAASAVATKLAIEQNKSGSKLPLEVVRCRIDEEHPSNDRFASDCEKWFGQPIVELTSAKYGSSIYGVFKRRKYIAGIAGAPCTLHLKKEVRQAFQRNGDLHVFGYTAEETARANRFIDANNDIDLCSVLIDASLTHADCLALLSRSGIALPDMYRLGYRNNNCIGCVKGGAGYWNKIRVDFPERFQRMAALERELGATIIKSPAGRIHLDELDPLAGRYEAEPDISCGIFCEMAEREIQDVHNLNQSRTTDAKVSDKPFSEVVA